MSKAIRLKKYSLIPSLFIVEETDGINLMSVILGAVTVLLTMIIIILAVKIRKLQTGTASLKIVAHTLVNCVNMNKFKAKHDHYVIIFNFYHLATNAEQQPERNKVNQH